MVIQTERKQSRIERIALDDGMGYQKLRCMMGVEKLTRKIAWGVRKTLTCMMGVDKLTRTTAWGVRKTHADDCMRCPKTHVYDGHPQPRKAPPQVSDVAGVPPAVPHGSVHENISPLQQGRLLEDLRHQPGLMVPESSRTAVAAAAETVAYVKAARAGVVLVLVIVMMIMARIMMIMIIIMIMRMVMIRVRP